MIKSGGLYKYFRDVHVWDQPITDRNHDFPNHIDTIGKDDNLVLLQIIATFDYYYDCKVLTKNGIIGYVAIHKDGIKSC